VDKPAYHFRVRETRAQSQSKLFMVVIRARQRGVDPNRMIGWLRKNQMTILSIGEILWDVFPDTVRLGGAPFNFAVHAHRLGHRVIFLSAVGDDERGRAALGRAAALGLTTEFIQVAAGRPTGSVSVRLDAEGHPDFTIHRPAAYDWLTLDGPQLRRLGELRPDWIYFGTLYPMEDRAGDVMRGLMDAVPGARRFYDVNLRRGCYTPELVRELLRLADAVKLNDEEAERFPDLDEIPSVAVTRGERGCAVRIGKDRAECPGYTVTVVDTVGAGDAFAAAFLHGLAAGWSAAKTGDFANRLGAVVASRAGAVPEWRVGELGVE
jgi:fructokinase